VGSSDEFDWEHWVQEFAFEHVTLAYTVSSHMSVLLNPEMANKIFLGSPHSYADIIQMQKEGIVTSFELQSQVSFKGEFEERDFVGRNIMGMVEGRDNHLKDSYVILSAHYDHLGIGPPVNGDSIYNGVMDNALGVAALLELSRILTKIDPKPNRSVILLFLTGEEKGLLGSKYYTDHPARPLYKTIAAINIDGLAAFDEFKDIIGVGAELSSLEHDLIHVAKSLNLNVSSIPEAYFYESENISRSDQFSFITAGIPSILLTEGINYKNTGYQDGLTRLVRWTKKVYHTPFDDLNQNINFKAAKQHAQVILKLTLYLANRTESPQWKPGSPYINAQLQSIAEKR
jgi:Zn-dependent M28 family amino/carboxypeptidase